MTVETHLHRARDRVESERALVSEKRAAFESFAGRVRDLSATGPQVGQVSGNGAGGLSAQSVASTGDKREAVRSAFAATVGEYGPADSVLASLRQELGADAALALAPTTNASFTTQLRTQLLSQVTGRKRELSVTATALDREQESVTQHLDTVEGIVTWLVEGDKTPLSSLGFDALQSRYERLSEFRGECEECLQTRQERLDSTTSTSGQVGVDHRGLVESLYDDFGVAYPVIATETRLLDVCTDAQRAVRAHLSRRG